MSDAQEKICGIALNVFLIFIVIVRKTRELKLCTTFSNLRYL